MAKTLISTPLDLAVAGDDVCEVDVTSGIDGTYAAYEFHFVNMVPSTNASILSFQGDVGTATTYQQEIMSSSWEVEHDEGDTSAVLQYRAGRDQANGTGYQHIGEYIYDDGDTSGSGILTLYGPSNTGLVTHWMSVFSAYGNAVAQVSYHAGQFQTVSPITRIRFVMTANDRSVQGDIKAGTIKLYGVT